MSSFTIESPAKLNLSLRIVRKRRDGYHELFTLFHRISLRDALHLKKQSSGIRIVCSHPRVPKGDNLIMRAFRLLKEKHPFPGGVTVHLTKRIPVGGGLGGGSSNAAALLTGINRLLRLRLSQKELIKLGGVLGSDVPFFLSGLNQALGRGRGERLKPVPLERRLWFLLFPSARGISTREVYRHHQVRPKPALYTLRQDLKRACQFLRKGRTEEASRFLTNDLSTSAERIRPSLGKRRKWIDGLRLGTCHLSGSGPTLFLIYTSRAKALTALRRVRRGKLSESPLICHSY